MKRSNHKTKKGEHKPVVICRWCKATLASKYQEKNHVCKG